MEKVDELKRPLIIGETLLVPCLKSFEYRTEQLSEEELWMDLKDHTLLNPYQKKYTPIINHPHSDRENGQKEIHYHIDDRFTGDQGEIQLKADRIRPRYGSEVFYVPMRVIRDTVTSVTPVRMIAKSKLKHRCIHKGKCPHRGYDLSQITPINGIITCPLHSLQFDAESGKIIN